MTTAHRATWKAARGGLQEEGSFRLHAPSVALSSKDAPTERALKKRHLPTEDASREDMRLRIEEGDKSVSKRPRRSRFGPSTENDTEKAMDRRANLTRALLPPPESFEGKPKERSTDVDEKSPSAKEGEAETDPGNEEKDNESGAVVKAAQASDNRKESGEDSEEDEDDDDSDEDEAELLAELERIRKEREFARAKKQAEEQERLECEETAKAAVENPLLTNLNNFNDEISETASIATGSVPAFAVRRRWDDDVVFRNQAQGERKQAPRFLNDTIRNDFHKRFMKQYMQ